jgi:hypothetical protein
LRLWLFALVALFCLFEFNNLESGSRRRWLSFGNSVSDHPSGYFRLMSAMTTASVILGSDPALKQLKDVFENTWKVVLGDVRQIAGQLGIQDSWSTYLRKNSTSEGHRMFENLQRIRPELDACSLAVRDHYFLRGVRVDKNATHADAHDPYHLGQQTVEIFDEHGNVRERRSFFPPRIEYYDQNGKLVRVVSPTGD